MPRLMTFIVALPLIFLSSLAVAADPAEVKQAADGTLRLRAEDAQIVGKQLALHIDPESGILWWWQKAAEYPIWRAAMERPGKYALKLTYSCAPDSEGARYEVRIGEGSVSRTVVSTGSWEQWRTIQLAIVEFRAAASVPVEIRVIDKPKHAVMNLRRLVFEPLK